MRKYVTI